MGLAASGSGEMAPWKGNRLKTPSGGRRVSRRTLQACAQVRVRVSLAAPGPGRGPAQPPVEFQAHARWWAFPGGFNQGTPCSAAGAECVHCRLLAQPHGRHRALGTHATSPTPPRSIGPAPRTLAALAAAVRSLPPARPSCRRPRGCWNWALVTSAPSAHSSHWGAYELGLLPDG